MSVEWVFGKTCTITGNMRFKFPFDVDTGPVITFTFFQLNDKCVTHLTMNSDIGSEYLIPPD